jgi:hypothetical protein
MRQRFREFDGLMFVFHETVLSKREAERKARDYRKEGFRVRVIPVSQGYDLYWKSGRKRKD